MKKSADNNQKHQYWQKRRKFNNNSNKNYGNNSSYQSSAASSLNNAAIANPSNAAGSDSESSDGDFLLTSTEKAAKRLAKKQTHQSPVASLSLAEALSSAPHLPGYYYDPQQKKYFKITQQQDFAKQRNQQKFMLKNAINKAKEDRKTPAARRTLEHSSNLPLARLNSEKNLFNLLSCSALHPQKPREFFANRINLQLSASLLRPLPLQRIGHGEYQLYNNIFNISGEQGIAYHEQFPIISIGGALSTCLRATNSHVIHSAPSFYSALQLNFDEKSNSCGDVEENSDNKREDNYWGFRKSELHNHSFSSPITSICHSLSSVSHNFLISTTLLGSNHTPGQLKIYNPLSTEAIHFNLSHGSAYSHAFSPSQALITVGNNRGAHILDFATMKPVRKIATRKSAVLATAFFDDFTAGLACRSGQLVQVDNRRGEIQPILSLNGAICSLMPLQRDNNYLVVSTMSGALQCFDRRYLKLNTGNQQTGAVLNYVEHDNEYSVIRQCSDAKELVLYSGGLNGAVRAWDLSTAKLLKTFEPFHLEDESNNDILGPVTNVCYISSPQPALLVGSYAGVNLLTKPI
jgi:hypothetical protein